MGISSWLNHFFDRHKAFVLVFSTAFSGFLGWVGNANLGEPSEVKVIKYVQDNPGVVKASEDVVVDPKEPKIMRIAIEDGGLVCSKDPYLGYEVVLILEVDYLRYLINTGYFSGHKVDLKERSSRLHELRSYCLDNDPLTDEERQAMDRWEREHRYRMYELSRDTRGQEGKPAIGEVKAP